MHKFVDISAGVYYDIDYYIFKDQDIIEIDVTRFQNLYVRSLTLPLNGMQLRKVDYVRNIIIICESGYIIEFVNCYLYEINNSSMSISFRCDDNLRHVVGSESHINITKSVRNIKINNLLGT